MIFRGLFDRYRTHERPLRTYPPESPDKQVQEEGAAGLRRVSWVMDGVRVLG